MKLEIDILSFLVTGCMTSFLFYFKELKIKEYEREMVNWKDKISRNLKLQYQQEFDLEIER